MVDPVCVEVLLHVLQTPLPPVAVVFVHFVPVVGREPPVLFGVARGTSIAIKLEVSRLSPHVRRAPRHPDRNVPLEGDAVHLSIASRVEQLPVEVVLDKVHPRHWVELRPHGVRDGRSIGGARTPGGAVVELVVESPLLGERYLESRVCLRPGLALFEPFAELRICHRRLLAHLVVNSFDELTLLGHHAGVVDAKVSVEFCHQPRRPPPNSCEVQAQSLLIVLADLQRADVGGVKREGGGG
mmetsp:Transcript_31857/g.75694  ORF Transcript_31857/g.75694 Transcript_31857/m.75694 type:complete len:241 (+) Transcript_31857:902-1624(+)